MNWFKDKFLSRKFLAAVAAVAAAATGVIPWSDAVNVVLLWITVQGLQDAVTAIPSGSSVPVGSIRSGSREVK